MTKKFEFNWQIPVPEILLNGGVFDRWTEEKDNTELELACTFKVDEYGFFIYWKSEGRVSLFRLIFVCFVPEMRAYEYAINWLSTKVGEKWQFLEHTLPTHMSNHWHVSFLLLEMSDLIHFIASTYKWCFMCDDGWCRRILYMYI